MGPTLGTNRDSESDGTPSANADGDDTTGIGDEDGVALSGIKPGQQDVQWIVQVANASGTARLDAWVDFNGNGIWEENEERIADNVVVSNGPNSLIFDVPAGAVLGTTFARFRVSTAGNLTPTGEAADGEVEDYPVRILPPSPDLLATSFDAQSDHLLMGQTQVTFTITNQGDVDAGAFDVHLIFSVDDIIGNGDDVIIPGTTRTITGLSVGAFDNQSIDVQLDRVQLFALANAADPVGQGVGYQSQEVERIGLVIDVNDAVVELNEMNNSNQGLGLDADDVTYFPWDRDGDGQVTPLDALAMMQALGTFDLLSDLDGDGVVTTGEVMGVLRRLGYLRNGGIVEAVADPTVLDFAFSQAAGSRSRTLRSRTDRTLLSQPETGEREAEDNQVAQPRVPRSARSGRASSSPATGETLSEPKENGLRRGRF